MKCLCPMVVYFVKFIILLVEQSSVDQCSRKVEEDHREGTDNEPYLTRRNVGDPIKS